MVKKYKKIILLIFVIGLLLRIFFCFSPYFSYDEIEFFNFDLSISNQRPPFIFSFSIFFQNKILARIFLTILSTTALLLILPISKKILNGSMLPFLFLIFNPLHIRLSSMYLTDAMFFSFVIIFFYCYASRKYSLLPIISFTSTTIRYEGLILIIISMIYFYLKKIRHQLVFSLFISIFILPLILRGVNLYQVSHKIDNPEASYYYYLFTPFLITGFFAPFALISLLKNYKLDLILFLIFMSFSFFYFIFKIGSTFADRFRYVLPTLLPSSIYISKYFENKKSYFYVILILNLVFLIYLWEYRTFRESVKYLIQKILF